MKVVLADDEPLARDLLRVFLAEIPGASVVGEAEDGEALIDLVDRLSPDVVILDVEMPGLSGLQAALELDCRPARPELIFVTAHDRHAAEAFNVDAADYVLKPVRAARLKQAIERVQRRLDRGATDGGPAERSPEDGEIWAPVRNGRARVRLGDIIRIEAAKDHAIIHTRQRSYMVRSTMAALEARLAGTALRRVHRSAFVRLSQVAELRRDGKALQLILLDGAVVPVGDAHRPEVLEQIGHLAVNGA
jgi:DNA-binding LytR/AlgR family response regulator